MTTNPKHHPTFGLSLQFHQEYGKNCGYYCKETRKSNGRLTNIDSTPRDPSVYTYDIDFKYGATARDRFNVVGKLNDGETKWCDIGHYGVGATFFKIQKWTEDNKQRLYITDANGYILIGFHPNFDYNTFEIIRDESNKKNNYILYRGIRYNNDNSLNNIRIYFTDDNVVEQFRAQTKNL